MATFQYIASSSKGESIKGSLSAADKSDLAKKLKEKGLFLVFCKGEAETETAAPPPPPAALREGPPGMGSLAGRLAAAPANIAASVKAPAWWSNMLGQKDSPETLGVVKGKAKGPVGLKELVVFTRQISISINAGMSFVDSLQSVVMNAKNPRMAYVLRHVLDDIMSGKKLSDALAAHPDVFKPVYISMVAAGEAGGFMPEALNRTAEFLEKEMELKGKIKSAMIYPILIGVVASLVVTGMMIFIVPTFIRVFKEMNAPLPLPTIWLLNMSIFVRHGGFLMPVAFVGLYFGLDKLRGKNEKFRVFWDEKMLNLPLFGKLTTLGIITRFIRTLATLVDNGVMALKAISISRQVVENRIIERVVDEIFSSVQQGNGISPVLYKSKYFPVLVANMVSTGEKTGALPEVLTKMADYYDNEVSSAIRDLLTMMEPLLIVVMAVIVGFIIAGLMLPVLSMSSLVS